jgi:uncharacterized protein YcaQ
MGQRQLLDWLTKKERKFTTAEVEVLVTRLKEYNAGFLTNHLIKHTDKVFEEWLKEMKAK